MQSSRTRTEPTFPALACGVLTTGPPEKSGSSFKRTQCGVFQPSWLFFSGFCPQNTPQTLKVKVAQLCLTLCDPMDYSPPGSSVHGASPGKILEWVTISSSRGSSQSRDRTQASRIAGRFLTSWATVGYLKRRASQVLQ